MSIKKMLVLLGTLIIIAVLVVACGPKAPTETPTQPPVETMAPSPEPAPTMPPVEVPYKEAWEGSGHNATDAEAFRHWDESDPAEVPTSCAKCHSTAGYQDFLGADGSEAGKVDASVPAKDNFGIQCVACHNPVTMTKTDVTFPSGVTVTVGDDSRCMECHQGRESKVSLDTFLAQFGENLDPDLVPAPVTVNGSEVRIGFRNIHYFPAAATLYGGVAMGGYQYDGKTYDGKFRHVEGVDTCSSCHDPHTLKVRLEKCAACHQGVAQVEDLKNIRMVSSASDYNGNGNVTEGIYYEIEGLKTQLLAAIQGYATAKAGAPISYDPATYPYFLGEDGKGYASFTPRLLKAAYNYQLAVKDPGNFAHGGKYTIQLLCDSIEDLTGTPCAARSDAGHFAGDTEPFRHWDTEGEVPGSCARCHSATGLPQFIKEGANISNEIANGFMCSTCHDEGNWPNRYPVASVTFPSGAVISFGGKDADGKFIANDGNLCLECHQGRESKASVDAALVKFTDPDAVDAGIRFRNVHYFAAGATLFGAEAQGAYMYDGKEYAGYFADHPINKCQDCHDVHALQPKVEACAGCHDGAAPEEVRLSGNTLDYDGDGDTSESIKSELDGLAEKLYATIQVYAEAHGGAISYNAAAYPYFFGADGKSYATWTPRLLKASYNYQYYQKDPGAFVHNGKFVAQFLIDSIEDLGGDITGMVRP